ncbi:Stage V sporulation protein D [Caprobacter fermentans]|uniref:PASTA domain-containing protein n=1 Tax=Caproicibacter fermentans TaxID=2576756 RepID=A0A6N8HXJ7_9FIRM|nr:penicillin-binding transpeptidase domain-containing protein [Caproicibacter fermentans]MVB10584.1 Stage V sporulation protein D [Caproicibacter fermentans]QNK41613.1 PASTA domain-containing protein [Caproicibacter fermentans]
MAKGTTVRMWHRTVFVLLMMMIAGFGAVIFSLVRLQIVEGETLKMRAVDNQVKDTVLTAQRGTIYDSNMKVLAQSATVWQVVLEPAYITDDNRDLIAAGLAQILGMDKNVILEHTRKKTYFDVIKRKVESDVKDKVVAFKDKNNITNGIRLIEDYKRYYPFGTLASTILGFTGTDSQGLSGIEAEYDSELTGVSGKLVTAKNAIGTDMQYDYEQEVPAQDGNSLVLTVDEVVQQILEKNLEEGLVNNKVQNRGCAIIMNVKTGGIIAMAVKGDFDPNDPFTIADKTVADQIAKMPDGEAKTKALREAQQAQWRNKCVSDTYQPGSVFKMITGSAAMEEGLVTETTQFSCPGYLTIGGRQIHDWRRSGFGSLTFAQGICQSSNVVFMKVGALLGPNLFYKYFDAFGFTAKTGIDLPGESRSIYYTAAQLTPINLATESFGQSFTITPIQMITACAAVANGGYLVKPHVVDRILDSDGNIVKSADTTPKRQVVSNDTSKRISAILRQDATTGTAKSGYIPGYRVAGKTGTSEKQEIKTSKEYIASYCGFAPADDPQIAMLVFYDEPHGNSYYGSYVSGPVFLKTMSEILPYLGVEPKYTEEEMAKLDASTPNVVGQTVAQAKNKVSSDGLTPQIYGDGEKVVSQVPEPGKSIPKGGRVVLFTDQQSKEKTVTVPDLVGLSLSQANERASQSGINISVSGAALTGTANAVSSLQSIAPGTKVAPGTVVTVSFIEPNHVE